MHTCEKRPRAKPHVDCQDPIDNKDVVFKARQSSARSQFPTDIAASFCTYRTKKAFRPLYSEVRQERCKPSEKETPL